MSKKVKLNKEQKEAQVILKKIDKDKSKVPDKKKNILEWSMGELKAYITSQTLGMKPKDKIKFAKDLSKRIETEKKKKKDL